MHIKSTMLPVLMMATLLSCSPGQVGESSTMSQSEIDIVNEQQITWEQLFIPSEDHYLVFFYSHACENCREIKDEVIAFALDDIVPMYFIDIKNSQNDIPITSDVESSYGASEIEEVSILGVPTLIEIYEGYIVCNVAGKDHCLTLLNEKRLIN